MSWIGRFIAALAAFVLVVTAFAPFLEASASAPVAVEDGIAGWAGSHAHSDHRDDDGGRGDVAHHGQAEASRVAADGIGAPAVRTQAGESHRLPSDDGAPPGRVPALPDEPPRG